MPSLGEGSRDEIGEIQPSEAPPADIVLCLSAVSSAAADATSRNGRSADVGPVISRT
jgi:hypothetical protein